MIVRLWAMCIGQCEKTNAYAQIMSFYDKNGKPVCLQLACHGSLLDSYTRPISVVFGRASLAFSCLLELYVGS